MTADIQILENLPANGAGERRSMMCFTNSRALAAILTLLLVPTAHGAKLNGGLPMTPLRLQDEYGRVPMVFEENSGQTDPAVRFQARGCGYAFFITPDEAVAVLQKQKTSEPPAVVRMRFPGANTTPVVRGEDLMPGRSHYFTGNDPSKWRSGVAQYGQVRLIDVYPEIDLVYYGNQQQLEYDFVVRAGGDPRQIRIQFAGADHIAVAPGGDLVLSVNGGEMRQHLPYVYQDRDGIRHQVRASYRRLAADEFGIDLDSYDTATPLIIDPVLSYSTYLGGSAFDIANSIRVDSAGNVYVAGRTASVNFPTANALQSSLAGGSHDGFVTKLNANGSALIFSTYLGGTGNDIVRNVAVDSVGDVYLVGFTDSTNFPTANAIQAAFGGVADGFVTKLNAAGSALVYSTYLGGSAFDSAAAVALDGSSSAFITGSTRSPNFPTVNEIQTTSSGPSDAFVTKLNAAGSALVYSTYLGGSLSDEASGIAVDASGSAFIVGGTSSNNFPTANALQAVRGSSAELLGQWDAFVSKLNAAGSAFVYSTYLGGADHEFGSDIALDGSGNAFIAGDTWSDDFPTANAIQSAFGGGIDAFALKMNAAGSAFIYSTYLGGSGFDVAVSNAVDSAGNAFVVGRTDSTNFPTANANQTAKAGGQDAFVAKLNSAGTALVYSTYLGGGGEDEARDVALDSAGSAYVTGHTVSTNFPTANALQATQAGLGDAFITKLVEGGAAVSGTKTAAGTFIVGGTVTYTITLTNAGPAPQGDYAGDEFTDVLPSTLTLVSASATSGTAVATVGTNTVTWNGSIAASGPVTITIQATIRPAAGGTTVSNQGTIAYDADGNGTNEATTVTDDPGIAGSGNPTPIIVPAAAIPAIDPAGMLALAALLSVLGVAMLKRG